MSNHLVNETSPYLLQHKDNPVEWYPWGKDAFERASKEDKPVFLSIGYSSCHWCHVFAHESFEDAEIAEILNKYFISVKVDKEERPDIDSVYMTFCQAFTGSGGWPTSIFMSPDKKPFFAGTYFPRTSQGGMIGFKDLLLAIHQKWTTERFSLLQQSDNIINALKNQDEIYTQVSDPDLTHSATEHYQRLYDPKHGGFGRAPKFPTPHILMFLLEYYQRYKNADCLNMAEHTLMQMYRGGLFDHIGFGFCRYSTDKKFLVPHFEKMLYDNALLIMAYCKLYTVTKKELYLEIAEKTANYIIREMTSPQGGFFCSQDADSNGEEGSYYLFTPDEITQILGNDAGKRFNRHFDITHEGNFEGKNIPNLLKSNVQGEFTEDVLYTIYDYRKKRFALLRDEKILTSWNSLMIGAMCDLYLVSQKEEYLSAAINADKFIRKYLWENNTLHVSYHSSTRGVRGFLDDYASYIFAQLSLYRSTSDYEYLDRAKHLCEKVLEDFRDNTGGFYMYDNEHEELILRPKETYDGAIPSSNSLMAYNLVRLSILTDEEKYKTEAENQLDFMAKEASQYPTNHSMFLLALLNYKAPQLKVTVVWDGKTNLKDISLSFPPEAIIKVISQPTNEYTLKNEKTTYYICKNNSCLPPTNNPKDYI